jgi:hypothetical protein
MAIQITAVGHYGVNASTRRAYALVQNNAPTPAVVGVTFSVIPLITGIAYPLPGTENKGLEAGQAKYWQKDFANAAGNPVAVCARAQRGSEVQNACSPTYAV